MTIWIKSLFTATILTIWLHADIATEMQCVGGDSESCFNLAYAYDEGNGVTQNKAKAVKFYELACEQKHAIGCYNLALMYANAEGVPTNASKAAVCYQQSCDYGEMDGCLNLALLYESGEGVAQDNNRSIALLTHACEKESVESCETLGYRYFKGLVGLTANKAKAFEYYEKTCEYGKTSICAWLGNAYALGKLIPKNDLKATQYHAKACQSGEAVSCYSAGFNYYQGRGVDANKSTALTYFIKACDLNNSQGCVTAGITYDDLADQKNAMKYYTIACSMDDAKCNNLGLAYKLGEGVKQDKEKALKLFLRACDHNVTSGCYNAGVLFEQKKEIKKAITSHTKACNGGRMQSCFRLGIVLESEGKAKQAQQSYEKACQGNVVDGCLKAAAYYTKKIHLDKVKSIALEKKACEIDSPYGCYILGLAYREGYGVKKDSKQALTWLNQSCLNKLDIGCLEMSRSFIDDRFGIETDLKRANAYMRKACTLGNKKACRLKLNILKDLKKECEHGDLSMCDYIAKLGYKETDTACDADKMISFLSKECEENDFKQCHKLGHFYTYKEAEKGLCKETLVRKGFSIDRAKKAIPLLKKACEGAIYRACSELGLLYAMQKKFTQAFPYFEKACEGGDGRGCSAIGNQYMEGSGVTKDNKKALELFKKGCAMGDTLGCKYYKKMMEK